MILVASYCRVSTDNEDQSNSFEAQRRYFKEYIARQPDWELYKVYADEGITGTSTKKRVQFNQMINDARKGKFKLIITKEVSRFSRNILDTIAFTRELKALGVGVLFMNDSINTLDPDAELRLSIMGSIAQEESRKTSARVKWGQTRQMERGVVFGNSMLGYDLKDGRLYLNPEGAEVVRVIFHKYGIEKKGTSIIARELREEGYLTFRGHTNWTNTHIVKILRNEKYVGDLCQKKTVTLDYLTHQKKTNHGEEQMVYIRDHHEPIISRELWDLVQDELDLKKRKDGLAGAGHSNRYLFSGKIKCGVCGASFIARTKTTKSGNSYKRWCCYNATNDGRRHIDKMGNEVGCDVGCLLRDDLAWDILQYAIKVIRTKPKWIAKRVIEHAKSYLANSEVTFTETQEEVEDAINQLEDKKREVLDAFFSKVISKDDVRIMNARYDEQIRALREKLEALRNLNSLEYDIRDLADDIETHIQMIANSRPEDELFCRNLLDKVVVHPNRKVEIRLNLLPPSWAYVLARLEELRRLKAGEEGGCRNDSSVSPLFDTVSQFLPAEKPLQRNGFSGRCLFVPSVPTSVSRPFSSSKGME